MKLFCEDCKGKIEKPHPKRYRCPTCQREKDLRNMRQHQQEHYNPHPRNWDAGYYDRAVTVESCPGDYFPAGALFDSLDLSDAPIEPGQRVDECWIPGMIFTHALAGRYKIAADYTLQQVGG